MYTELQKAEKRWENDEREIKEYLGYKDDDEFSIVKFDFCKRTLIYYTSEGKMTFTINPELLEDDDEYGRWCGWHLDWRKIGRICQQLNDDF